MSCSISNQGWERQPSPSSTPVQMEREREAEVQASKKQTLAQTAGEVAADCTAICCCVPLGLFNMLFVCFVKVPTGMIVRSVRKLRKLRVHKCRHDSCCSCKTRGASLLYSCEEGEEIGSFERDKVKDVVFMFDPIRTRTKEEMELEKELMMNLSGFGRSFSQRQEP